MTQPTKENLEKAKAVRKLMKKWLNTQATKEKADLLLAKNPEIIKTRRSSAARRPV